MLKTVALTEKWNKNTECVLLLGGFDGLHAGHKKLLARAKTYGLPVGIMTIFGGKDGTELFTFSERQDLFLRAGADFVFGMHFADIKDMSAEVFLQMLRKEFRVKAFVCGDDFRFGYLAKGTPETLECGGQVSVEVHEQVTIDGQKVSASCVKKLLGAGDIFGANRLLAEPFFFMGEVIKDRAVGRTLGFPTANVYYPEKKFPLKRGVYQTQVQLDGVTYKGITNYGTRPTFADDTLITETYLDGFSGDLYGKTLRVQFVRFLREVQKFDSVDELKKQLTEDIRRVREDD